MNTHTLPFLRVAGLSASINVASWQHDVQALWHAWQQSSLQHNLPKFSRSLYCVYHQYQADGSCQAVLGYLLTTDAPLPDNASDVWIAPQQYAVYDLPDHQPESAWAMWQQLQKQPVPEIERSYRADFESYPAFGAAKLYIGIAGEVEMHEEILDESSE